MVRTSIRVPKVPNQRIQNNRNNLRDSLIERSSHKISNKDHVRYEELLRNARTQKQINEISKSMTKNIAKYQKELKTKLESSTPAEYRASFMKTLKELNDSGIDLKILQFNISPHLI
jgi:Na+/phosphate symporter